MNSRPSIQVRRGCVYDYNYKQECKTLSRDWSDSPIHYLHDNFQLELVPA